eukprot:6435067-Prymnesium_polylepis.1
MIWRDPSSCGIVYPVICAHIQRFQCPFSATGTHTWVVHSSLVDACELRVLPKPAAEKLRELFGVVNLCDNLVWAVINQGWLITRALRRGPPEVPRNVDSTLPAVIHRLQHAME